MRKDGISHENHAAAARIVQMFVENGDPLQDEHNGALTKPDLDYHLNLYFNIQVHITVCVLLR